MKAKIEKLSLFVKKLRTTASAGSVSLDGVCENEGNLSFDNGFIVVDNPMAFAHRLN